MLSLTAARQPVTIPSDRAEERAEVAAIVTTFRSTSPLPIVEATAVPSSAGEIENAAIAIACAGQHFRRDDSRDRIRGIVKTVDVFEN